MKNLVTCLMVVLLLVAPLEAGCRVVSHSAVVVEQVVTPVFAPIAVFAVPAYAVGYLPPPAPVAVAAPTPVVQAQPQVQVAPQAIPATTLCEQRAAQLEARVGQLEALLRNRSPGNPPPIAQPQLGQVEKFDGKSWVKTDEKYPPLPPIAQPGIAQPQSQVPRGLAILQSKCASCHEEAVSREKGAITLFKGPVLLSLNDRAQAKILKEIYSGRMPKDGNLTDKEVAEIIGFLDQMK